MNTIDKTLSDLLTKVNELSSAIDLAQEYSYSYNVKLNAGLAVNSQTLHSKPFFLLGDVPFGVWPGPFFHFLECGFIFHILECGKVFVVVFLCLFLVFFFGDPPGD